MLTNYNKVVHLIQQMSTDLVTQAEQGLEELAKVDPQILVCLHNILKDNNTQQEYIQMIAASSINKLICDQKQLQIGLQKVTLIMIDILVDVDIASHYKRTLQRSIVHIIDNIQQPQLTPFRQIIFQLMKNEKLRDTVYLFIGCWCIPDIQISHIIYLLNVCLKKTVDYFFVLTSDHIMLAQQYNQIVKTWILVCDKLHKSQQVQAEKQMQELIANQSLATLILNVYNWMGQQPLYMTTTQGLTELNIIKTQVAELHLILLKKSIDYRKKTGVTPIIYELSKTMILRIMQNIELVCSQRQQLESYFCKDLILCYFKILITFIEASPQYFENLWEKILNRIILPYLETDAEEYCSFEEHPEEFIALIDDCSEKQKFGIFKTESCSLLEKLSDKSETITQKLYIPNFVVRFATDSILANIGVSISNQYQFPLASLGSAVILLCIYAYRIKEHTSECLDLSNAFNAEFLHKQSTIDRAKLYLLLGYCFDEIYDNKQKGQFWIHSALQDNQHPTVIKCCLDFISNVGADYYSDFFLDALIQRIEHNSDGALWQALCKLVQNQYKQISQAMMQKLIDTIYSRLNIQVQLLKIKQIKKTLVIINLIQILQTIVSCDGYCNDKPNLKQKIWKIVDILGVAEELSFEDEILTIVHKLIKQDNTLLQPYIDILPQILNIFKSNYSSKISIALVNQYLMKDHEGICLMAILKSLTTAIMSYLLEIHQKKNKKKMKHITVGYMLVLLQNLFFVHRNHLRENEVYEISSLAIRFLPDSKNDVPDKILAARALNLLLLCHTLIPTDFTWNRIQELCRVEVFFSYDIYVFQTIVESEIFNQPQISMKGQILKILAIILKLFKKRKQREKASKNFRKKYGKQKSRIKINYYAQYETQLKQMTIPFNRNGSQKRFNKLLSQLRLEYGNKMNQIFMYVSPDDQALIMQMANVTNLFLEQKRKIFNILKVKDVADDIGEEEEMERRNFQNEDSEDQDIALKRERKVKKVEKKSKKATIVMKE